MFRAALLGEYLLSFERGYREGRITSKRQPQYESNFLFADVIQPAALAGSPRKRILAYSWRCVMTSVDSRQRKLRWGFLFYDVTSGQRHVTLTSYCNTRHTVTESTSVKLVSFQTERHSWKGSDRPIEYKFGRKFYDKRRLTLQL